MRLQLPVASYAHRATPASTSRLVNCMVEALPPDAPTPFLLTRTPGVGSWTTVGAGPIQQMHMAPALGLLYVVSGGKLYSVTTGKVATELGTVGGPLDDDFDIDSNIDSVVVVNPPLAYYWTSPTFAQITDADFTSRGATDVEFSDNYMLFVDADSGRFFGSDLGSVTSYDALNFATAESSPDNLVGMKVDHRQVFLAGTQSCEIWDNTGIQGFPYEAVLNGFIEIGCLGGRTIQKLDNSIFWLANDYTVRRLQGATPARVSEHWIEARLRASTISSARASVCAFDGHLTYELSVDEATFVYDVTTQKWHERENFGANNWKWRFPTEFDGQMLVGDSTSNAIGYLDYGVYDDNGETLRMSWTYQPVYAEGVTAIHKHLEIIAEVGVGITSGQGSDPEILLEYSDDGGQTWKSLPNKKLGKIGEYRQRVTWWGLGSSRRRVYRAAVSDPVRVNIIDTALEVEGGRV